MTKDEAIAKAKTRWWETATPREIVAFQLYEDLLCMDFGAFHKAMEDVLGRPVFTHEFAMLDKLKAEFEGHRMGPTDPINTLIEAMGDNPKPVIVVLGEE